MSDTTSSAKTGFLDPAPGTTEAQHREMLEMEEPQGEDLGPPNPPPPVPPVISGQQGDQDDRESESGDLEAKFFGDLPSGISSLDIGPPPLSVSEKLAEVYGMKESQDVPSAFAQNMPALLPELQAFRVALEDETDSLRLAQLMDAYECFQKAFEYGVGMKHYGPLTTAVRALDYDKITLYIKILRTLIGFQER